MRFKNKFAIILVRVSTIEQDYQAQINDLVESAKHFGFTDFKVIESKETGFADIDNKVGLNEMFKFVEQNPEYNTVIATEMSRLGRRQSVLQTVKEWFIDNKVQLYIKDSGFWLLNESGEITQNGEMAFTMYALFAESEIRTKKDRFMRSRKSLMENGISISGKLLFGYKRIFNEDIKKNKLFPDEINSPIVVEVFNWYLYGFKGNSTPSIKAIALHCIKEGYPKYTHSKRNVNKLLKEEAYTGFKINNRKKNPKYGIVSNAPEYITSSSKIKYPQIIDHALFDAVQEHLKKNMSKSVRDTKHVTLLSRLLKCPSCGRSLSANYRFNRERPSHSYRCTSRSGTTPCGNQFSGSMQLFDSTVWSVINRDWTALSKSIIESNPEQSITNINVQLKNLENRENVINNEVGALKKTMQSLQTFRDLDMTSSINSIVTKLKQHQKDMSKINEAKLKLGNELIMIKNNYDENQTIIDTVYAIEKSKELLKQYINKFVEDIQILNHTKKYTSLKIKFKNFSYSMDDERPIHKTTYVMIDKRITRDIKLWHMSDYGKYHEYINYDNWFEEIVDEVFRGERDWEFKIHYIKLDVINNPKIPN